MVVCEKQRTSLGKKNQLVILLRDKLMKLYGTTNQYTSGASDSVGEISTNCGITSYSSRPRRSDEPRDLSGFYFRKDLCNSWKVPRDENKIYCDINDIFNKEGIKAELKKNRLDFKLDDEEYFVFAHIDGGYAGEIHVSLVNLPKFS